MLRFTADHEWLRIDGDVAVVGITEHAQEQLGDLVFVELPASGKSFEKGAPAAVVESCKAASDAIVGSATIDSLVSTIWPLIGAYTSDRKSTRLNSSHVH